MMNGHADSFMLLNSLLKSIHDITQIRDFHTIHKRDCTNLVRRVKLLLPLFEEVNDIHDFIPEPVAATLGAIENALYSAKQLLHFCRDGCKLYMVLESEATANNFISVTRELEFALDGMRWDMLDISDEIREQVELLHTQLKRAKGRAHAWDTELFDSVMFLVAQKENGFTDRALLLSVAKKLQLRTVAELKAEAHALQQLMQERGCNETFEHMMNILRKLKALGEQENMLAKSQDFEQLFLTKAPSEKSSCPIVPDDFKCPISLELLKDPVIVATGQTYERASIQKWLENHRTCPKTGQVLPHTVLTPNYVLRSLIAQWCETNGVEAPNEGCKADGTNIPVADRNAVDVLVQKLSSGQLDLQRAAAGELRLLAKRNSEKRVCIAEAGAIPHLVNLLSSEDFRTQEHAVTTLLNLSIHDCNKGAIVQAGAIFPIVRVLRQGSMEARENAAATLFSLSVLDEIKVMVGASGAIPALVDLLKNGTSRGRKDAATALFNLCIYQGNKPKAVRAGVIEPLMKLLMDPDSGMVDEALAILAILVTHQEGRIAMGNASAVVPLVNLIENGSSRNKENAAAVLLALSASDSNHLVTVRQLGGERSLIELSQSGTARARRKAANLLEQLNKTETMY